MNLADIETLKKIIEELNFNIDKAPFNVTEEALEAFFTRYGEVFSCEIKKSDSKKTNLKSNNFGLGHVLVQEPSQLR